MRKFYFVGIAMFCVCLANAQGDKSQKEKSHLQHIGKPLTYDFLKGTFTIENPDGKPEILSTKGFYIYKNERLEIKVKNLNRIIYDANLKVGTKDYTYSGSETDLNRFTTLLSQLPKISTQQASQQTALPDPKAPDSTLDSQTEKLKKNVVKAASSIVAPPSTKGLDKGIIERRNTDLRNLGINKTVDSASPTDLQQDAPRDFSKLSLKLKWHTSKIRDSLTKFVSKARRWETDYISLSNYLPNVVQQNKPVDSIKKTICEIINSFRFLKYESSNTKEEAPGSKSSPENKYFSLNNCSGNLSESYLYTGFSKGLDSYFYDYSNIMRFIQEHRDTIANSVNAFKILYSSSNTIVEEVNKLEGSVDSIVRSYSDLIDSTFIRTRSNVDAIRNSVLQIITQLNEDNFAIVASKDDFDNDKIKVLLQAIPRTEINSTTLKYLRSFPYDTLATIKVKSGIKIDFSSGFFWDFGLDNHSYRLDTFYRSDANGNRIRSDSVQIRKSKANSHFTPAFGILLHVYNRSLTDISWGGAFGLSLKDGVYNSYLGLSLMFGKRQRWIVSAGLAGSRVKYLSKKYYINQQIPISQNLQPDLIPLEDVYRFGGFASITFNISQVFR